MTNQDGFNALDQLVDGNKRPLLQPDPTGSTGKLLFGRGITVVSNGILKTATSKAPIYFGDFHAVRYSVPPSAARDCIDRHRRQRVEDQQHRGPRDYPVWTHRYSTPRPLLRYL